MTKPPALCQECRTRPKQRPYHRCLVCRLRRDGVTERVEASRRRLAAVPDELRVKVVPAKRWPVGQRWCGGCQSFVDLEDVGKGASQCKACVSAKNHGAMVEKVYGIDAAEYDRLFKLQGGRCAICRNVPKKTRFAVDHDHKTGANRGLLCKGCNHDLLGGARDNVNILQAAVSYMLHPPTSGDWEAPEESGRQKIEPAQPPSKASRLVNGVDTPSVKESPPMTGPPYGLSIAELISIGGGRDENGLYRLYQHRDDLKPPF